MVIFFQYSCRELTTAVSFSVTGENGETLRTVDLPAISTADLTAQLQTSTTVAGGDFEVRFDGLSYYLFLYIIIHKCCILNSV